MLRILTLLLTISYWLFANSAVAEELAIRTFNYNQPSPTISLVIQEDGNFQATLLDALKSGQELQIEYSIKVKNNKWWAKTIASGNTVRQVTFNHRSNSFLLSDGDVTQYLSTSNNFMEALLWLDMPVLIKHPIKSQNELTVNLEINFSPINNNSWGNNWLEWLALDRFWKTRKIEQKVKYIAQ